VPLRAIPAPADDARARHTEKFFHSLHRIRKRSNVSAALLLCRSGVLFRARWEPNLELGVSANRLLLLRLARFELLCSTVPRAKLLFRSLMRFDQEEDGRSSEVQRISS
jgi:hypothetical protein